MNRALVVGCVAVASAAALGMPAATAAGPPVYHHAASGRTVHLTVGTRFSVELKTCADCGYSWKFAHRPDHSVVKVLGSHVVSHAKPPAVGGEATTIYRFKVVGTGRTTFRLVEHAPSGKVSSHFRLTEVAKH